MKVPEPGYIIAEIEVTDPGRFEEYKRLAQASIAQHGGTYVIRGGDCEALEGDWRPGRIVVLKFPSVSQAKAWYTSAEYKKARDARAGAAVFRILAIEGLAG